MRVVSKFPLRVNRWLSVPVGPGPVRLAAIDPETGAPAVWIEHDFPATPYPIVEDAARNVRRALGTRLFAVFRTGDEIDPEDRWVGSMVDRTYVWHVYEREGES